jgi:hypothetical protein
VAGHAVTAAEPALEWEPGAFLEAYSGNREQANELALDAAVIVPPLRDLLSAKGGYWQGTATELLHDLDEQAPERTRKAQGWPTNGRALSNALRRIAPNLRAGGLEVTFPKGRTKGRIFKIEQRLEQRGKFASSASSASSVIENQALTEDAREDATSQEDAKRTQHHRGGRTEDASMLGVSS